MQSCDKDSQMPEPIVVKVIILSMFEPTSRLPGEQKLFADRLNLTQTYSIAGTNCPLLLNSADVGSMVVGIGATKPAISLMSLGFDPRFDLRNTYFLIAGIAGIDPKMGSLGSVVWSKYVVDGDLAFDIDAREMPEDWPTGIFPLGSNRPYEMPYRSDDGVFLRDEVVKLNSGIFEWGYDLTRNVPLVDTPEMKMNREEYVNYQQARAKPFVLRGEVLAAQRFWHGERHTDWARRWVDLWTQGAGTFAATNMDDMGNLRALKALAEIGKVDFNRVMLMRSASNYCMQPPCRTAAENMIAEGSEEDRYPAYLPSLENLYRASSRVVETLVDEWEVRENKVPGF